MKNYFKWMAINKKKEFQNNFILKYEVIKNKKKIKVFYANGNISVSDYTVEKEESIISKMKEQINKNKNYLDDFFKDDLSLLKISMCLFVLIMLIGIGCFFVGQGALIMTICTSLLSILAGLGFISVIIGYGIHKKYYNDYQKNKLFLENEQSINEVMNSKKIRVLL